MISYDDLRLRLDVSLHRSRLDQALAEGASPGSDPALALRARQLTSRSTREAMAATIDDVLEEAEEPPSRWASGDPHPPLRREDVLRAGGELATLADDLRRAGEFDAQAAALAATLVWDPASPLYGRTDTSLREWTKAVRSTAHFRA